MEMEVSRDESGPSQQKHSNTNWWPADFIEKFGSISSDSKEEILSKKESMGNNVYAHYSYQTASQILWSTGMLSEPIPDGFYSVIREKRLKDLFDYIPTLEELSALELEGLQADIILVDAEKDKKLSMLKQLIVTLVKGLSSNPAAMIKKIAGLVSDYYKRPNLDLSPAKAALEETSYASGNRGVQMLGQIKNGSCRPRAILFKVLADSVGLESSLMAGFPNVGAAECIDSYKHMSVIVVLNSIELLVDLMLFPGQLIPRSTKAIFMTHVSAARESDSAENDSCDSSLEPNSPLYGFSDKVDPESADKDDGLQYQRRLEASLNVPRLSLRSMMFCSTSIDRNLSLSHSEPNIATTFWRRSWRKVIAEQRTASSSYRSEGASMPETRKLRRRSFSITPEIGDDIVRAVRAMNETLKQNRLLREQGDNRSYPHSSDDEQGSTSSKKWEDDKFNLQLIYHPRGQEASLIEKRTRIEEGRIKLEIRPRTVN